jgi:hypothetical protein
VILKRVTQSSEQNMTLQGPGSTKSLSGYDCTTADVLLINYDHTAKPPRRGWITLNMVESLVVKVEDTDNKKGYAGLD